MCISFMFSFGTAGRYVHWKKGFVRALGPLGIFTVVVDMGGFGRGVRRGTWLIVCYIVRIV